MRLRILPFSLVDFDTSLTCVEGVCHSLYCKGLFIRLSVGMRMGVCQIFFSYTIGAAWIEYNVLGFFGMISMDQFFFACAL